MSSQAANTVGKETPGNASAPNGNFFEVTGLHKYLGNQHVLRGLDLTVRRGDTMVILGASGGGKSVFLKHLIGLMKPDAGEIRVDGTEIAGLSERELFPVRRSVGILFQDGALFDSMNVAQNVAFPLREAGVRDEEEIERRVIDSLESVGLREHMEKMPIALSGGMRKRVALARAVVSAPDCILYDEPTAGLDPVVSDSINRLIRRMQQNLEVTSVVVTHDLTSAYHIADRISFLVEGRIYFSGTPEALRSQTDPVIVDFLQGRSHEDEIDAVPASRN